MLRNSVGLIIFKKYLISMFRMTKQVVKTFRHIRPLFPANKDYRHISKIIYHRNNINHRLFELYIFFKQIS